MAAAGPAAPLLDASEASISVDELEIGPQIGAGSFGKVFRGRYRGHEVAIKRAALVQADMIKYLHSELAALSSVSHPHLIRYFGAGQKGREVFIVTEFMPGGTLSQVLAVTDVPLPWKLRVKIALDVAQGIAHLHAADLIHRDVKTENILLDDEWRAVLSDYGFARKVADLRSGPRQTMTLLGTDAFCSPEIMFNEPYDHRADVFSFGCVMAELITRRVPGIDGFLERTARNKFAPDIDAFRAAAPEDCPASFLECACQCLAYEPEDRPTAEDAHAWLADLLGELEGGAAGGGDGAELPKPSEIVSRKKAE